MRVAIVGLVLIFLPRGPVAAQEIHQPPAQARPAWDDPTLTADEQARLVLDAATALDEQAQRAPTVTVRRAKWQEATRVLDNFLARSETNPAAASLRFQAAVFLWARARSLFDQVDLLPATEPDRIEVARELDDVVARLQAIKIPPDDKTETLRQNVQFRLAQTLADRAKLRPEADPARVAAEREAQRLLDRSLDAPRLKVFARLLHAELANRLGEFGPAQIEAEEIEKYRPAPPLIPLTDVKVRALAGRAEFAEANRLADQAAASPEQKALWKLRVALAERRYASLGRDRPPVEATVFAAALPLRGSSQPEATRGLMELARGVDEPAAGSPPDWWELLVDGQLLLHDPERAARLAERGAERARGITVDRAAALRVKAGACWFQASKYPAADAILTRVADDPGAPQPLRAKAGMLRALSRGRALADGQPGATRVAYLAALEAQVRDFGAEPSSGEARWLLGKVRLAAERREDAIQLWAGIAHGQPRWLEAQAAAADLAIATIEAQWANHDLAALEPQIDVARKQIRQALDQASEGDESITLGASLARLESIPGAGHPAEAIALLDRLLRAPASSEQHQRLRLDRMVALAEQNRFADAELVARNEARTADIHATLPSVRVLDQWAAITESDLIRKRTGSLIRSLLDPWVEPSDRTPEGLRDEVRLRQIRALLFAGDALGAKRSMARWGGPTGKVEDSNILRDLGDTYFRFEAYALAVDAERLRGKRLAAGTPAWFDSRYLLALALYRSERGREARQVIEATSILHPDLGGGEIRSKFERLSQKINAD